MLYAIIAKQNNVEQRCQEIPSTFLYLLELVLENGVIFIGLPYDYLGTIYNVAAVVYKGEEFQGKWINWSKNLLIWGN